ncbi:MAG: alpha/beta hydrolase fold domain-containing protein [Bacteroidota bacterium]
MEKLILFILLFQFSTLIAQPNGVDIAYGSHTSHRLDYSTATNPNSPVLMVVHGGGWAAGDKAGFANVAQFFKNAGYAVVNINYRLSSEVGYPGHPAIPQDVACAIAWTKVNAGLINGDSSRIIMYGHSAGAHLCTLHGLTHPQSLLNACGYNAGLKISGVIAANAALNFEYINPLRYADIKPMVLDSANYWDDAAPAHNLSNGNKTKFMIIAGQSDGFLGTQQSIVFNDSMSTYDYCKRFYFVPGTHTSFLDVSDPIFNSMLDFADSLWAGQLCPSPTGFTENKKNKKNIELYPNPVQDKIFIKGVDLSGHFDAYVYDVFGKMQFQSSAETEFNLAGLPAGLYILRVKQNDSDTCSKFIKE